MADDCAFPEGFSGWLRGSLLLTSTPDRSGIPMTEAERTAFEDRIAAMNEAELCHACINAELESEEAELLFGEAERRNVDL